MISLTEHPRRLLRHRAVVVEPNLETRAVGFVGILEPGRSLRHVVLNVHVVRVFFLKELQRLRELNLWVLRRLGNEAGVVGGEPNWSWVGAAEGVAEQWQPDNDLRWINPCPSLLELALDLALSTHRF